MTIPASVFNACDCCGYGFEIFEVPDNPYWYFSTTSGDIYKRLKSNLSADGVSSFANASRIVQVDRAGNFYYINTTSFRKYQYDGTQLWAATIPTTVANSIHRFDVDSNLNVYVAGVFGSFGSTQSARVLKLDSSGNTVWTFTKTPPELGPANTFTSLIPHGVSVDLEGYTHVTGERLVALFPGSTDRFRGPFEIHIDPDGGEVWSDLSTNVGGSPAVVNNYGLQCVCDESGNVICRYGFRGNNPGDGIVLKGYSSGGSVLFSHLRPSAGTGTDTEFPDTELIRYLNGGLYCCGPINQAYDTAPTFFSKYNGADYTNLVWNDAPTTGTGKQVPLFTLDRSGNMYGVWADVSPSRTVMRKLNGSTGSLMVTDSVLNEIPFFPMAMPGNPVQFFR